MGLSDIRQRESVIKAIEEFDELGQDAFLTKYGFGLAKNYFLRYEGKLYDSKAICGVAHAYEFPERGPLRPPEFAGGEATVQAKLESLGFQVQVGRGDGEPRFWWVNQGLNWNVERNGGFIWAPKQNAQGTSFYHWRNVSRVRRGDIVFHYRETAVRAVSVAQSDPSEATRPADLPEGPWEQEGWTARLEYTDLSNAIPITQVGQELLALGLNQGPIARDGVVKQGYLFSLTDEAVVAIAQHADLAELPEPVAALLRRLRPGKAAWIFQANPQEWSFDEALRNEDTLRWTVSQHGGQMGQSDRAYLWKSGPDAGIYASGVITDGPAMMSDIREQDAYWIDPPDDLDAEALRVEISVTQKIVDSPVRRDVLKSIMPELGIISFAQRTNALVTPEEQTFLDLLVDDPDRQQVDFDKLGRLIAVFEQDPEWPGYHGFQIKSTEHSQKQELADRLGPTLRAIGDGQLDACGKLLEILSSDTTVKSRMAWLLGGGFGFIHVTDFCVLLEHGDRDAVARMLVELFDEATPVDVRTKAFRDECRERYQPLFDAGEFPVAKKGINPVPTNWPALLLFCFDPDTYTIYKPKDFDAFMVGVDYPQKAHGADGRYGEFCELCSFLLAYARLKGRGVDDLIDAHSLVWDSVEFSDMAKILTRGGGKPPSDLPALLGSAPGGGDVEGNSRFVADTGAYSAWWSYPIKPEYEEQLREHGGDLYLYIRGAITHRSKNGTEIESDGS